jgi:hypothetical protein
MSHTLSDEQRRALSCVLDEIIPASADGRLPGAGMLGLVARIEQVLERSPELVPVIAEGLAGLDAVAGAEGFAALERGDRRAALDEVAAAQPGFLPGLIFHTYLGYYASAEVQEGLGLEGRPPHPQGYEMEPNDLSLVEAVKARGRVYRMP